jgi:hypothetical protein
MNFEASLICDSASEYPQGKLCILGAFDTIGALQAPVKYPHCAVVFRLRFERGEEGKRVIRLVLIDEDGRPVGLQVDGEINVVSNAMAASGALNLILNINDLTLQKFGAYRFDFFINGEHKTSIPLHVVQANQAKKAA